MSRSYVFVHGFGQGSWIWDDTITQLHEKSTEPVNTLALDVPGCGRKRDFYLSKSTIHEIVGIFVDEVKALGGKGDVLVGHSAAGLILPMIVEAMPNHFSHIAYITCVAPVDDQTVVSWPGGLPEASTALPKTLEELTPQRLRAMFCNDMTVPQADEFMAKLGSDHWPDAVINYSGWRYEHLQKVESTYICCLRDMTIAPEWQRTFAKRLFTKSTINIDAGHQAMNTKPAELAEILLNLGGVN